MTLLITVFAAVTTTVFWYNQKEDSMMLSTLLFLFWGASIMWFVDAIFEFAELKEAYFSPSPEDMINDMFLGLSVVALALVIWVVLLLVKDPKGRLRERLKNVIQ